MRTGRPRGTYGPIRTHSTAMRALAAIRHGGATLGEIVAVTGRRRGTVYMGLQAWIRRGMVRRPRYGWYERVDAALEARP